jgi:hypothetical protein
MIDVKKQSQQQISSAFEEIRKRLDIKERELIQMTEQASDDVGRKLMEGSKNTASRLNSFHIITEALKNSLEQPEQYKLFIFWQEQSKKIIKDLQEIDKMPLNISLNDTNRFAIDK